MLDYVELNSAPANFTFQSDTTYLITDGVNISGTATFEGGTVIKFSDSLDPDTYYYDPAGWYGYGALAVNNLIFQAGAYRPVLFTSMDDDSVGEVISGSTGSPAAANIVYFSTPNAYSGQIKNCRFAYAHVALMVYNFNQLLVADCQFVNNTIGVGGWGNVLTVENCLFSGPIGIRDPEGDQFNLQNVTMDNNLYNFDTPQIDAAMDANFDGRWTSYAITNCLFSGSPYTYEEVLSAIINDGGTAVAACSYDVNDGPGGDFQTAGGGSYYLAPGSPYHNAGTATIDPNLLADLATKTTYPPVVYDNDASTFTGNNTFTPAGVPRDNTGTPDLGYHYDPVDVLVGGSDLSANLTLTAGTVLAWFDDYGVGNIFTCGQPYGLSLNDGATLTATGTATAPCWLTRYNMVQEGALGSRGWLGGLLLNGSGNTPLPQINAQFTKFSTVNSVGNVLRDYYAAGVAGFTDCEFYYGVCSYWPSYYFTNCLFVRAGLSFYSSMDASSFTFQNCTFWQQSLFFYRYAGQSPSQWTIRNTTFDGTTISTYDNLAGNTNYTHFDYNAFRTGASRLEVHGPHDILVNAGYNWQTSWLGNYYLPANSPLIRKGGPTADQLGLYEFTTQASQVKETNAIVDIGYHYVATDAFGNPLCTLWVGIPDYLADGNGNGALEAWELYYFGRLGLDPNASWDDQGNTLLYDFQNQSTNLYPNWINFTMRLGDQHFNTTNATGTFLTLGGVPGYQAVLVNSTNFAAANWTNYNGLVHLHLGPADGADQVWLGLKGPAPGAPPTWVGTTVSLDRVPPAVVLTSPTNAASFTTAVPYAQLQGFAAKSLQSVSLDLSNALTVVTGLPGTLGGRYLDTNLLALTTNYFHCFDVPLTNGLNRLTLHVTDLAGNTTVTNLQVTLNYAIATNPVVQLTWPQNGMQICGGSFTLRGLVDDPTAGISATITDTHGDTNVIAGDVERTGVLWVENLPLNSGTNWITLNVTNAAGLTSQTNLTVVQSPLTLALTAINDDLWQPVVDVSGVISDPSYQVWVNGVPGTNNGDGTWNAYNVPISASGVASFDLSATNGGGDPDASTNVYKPAEIVIQSAVWNADSLSYMGALEGWETNSVTGNYSATNGGWETDNTTFENTNQVPQSYNNDEFFIGTNQMVYDIYLATSLGDAWFPTNYPADINLAEGGLNYSGATGICRPVCGKLAVSMILHRAARAGSTL